MNKSKDFRLSKSNRSDSPTNPKATSHITHKTKKPEEKNSKALTHTPSMTRKKSGVELEMKAKKKKSFSHHRIRKKFSHWKTAEKKKKGKKRFSRKKETFFRASNFLFDFFFVSPSSLLKTSSEKLPIWVRWATITKGERKHGVL